RILFMLFFFSSRRRHTRFSRDWSSDVCSSDLDLSVRAAMNAGVGGSTRASALMAALAVGAGNLGGGREVYLCVALWQSLGSDLRSEERRVGKECGGG